MKTSAALAGGLAGTLTVASIHEALRRVVPDAPRMDLLDMELIQKGMKSLHKEPPAKDQLQLMAVGGELLCDTAYYGLVGMNGKKGAWMRGALLGLFAGVTAVVLPKPLGLPDTASNKTRATQLMTIGLYLAGGLAAAAITELLDGGQRSEPMKKGKPMGRKGKGRR
jgi:hypothetical protein